MWVKAKFCLVFALINFMGTAGANELTFSQVMGGGDTPLNVVEAGSVDGKEILLIHGVSQSYLSWKEQLTADELQSYRMVAFDLRGHGNSAKPWKAEDYADTKLWADDVAAVISATNLKKPIVVAWSYGGIVLMDYIRHYGTDQISAIHLVANSAALIDYIPDPDSADELVMQQMVANRSRQQSLNIEQNIASVRFAVPLLTETNMGPEWRQQASLVTMMTPSYVRRALALRTIDNKGLSAALGNLPILLSYGTRDGSVTEPMADAFLSRFPNTMVSRYEGGGHSPFVEASIRFNRELSEFVNQVGR